MGAAGSLDGGKIIRFGRITADVISVVLEYVDTPEEYIRLRLVSRTFDKAAFRILLFKRQQSFKKENELCQFLAGFIPEDEVHLELKLEKI